MGIIRTLLPIGALLIGLNTYAESPYNLETVLTLETVNNLQGGLETGSTELANLDITFGFETANAGWWPNGEFFVYALGDSGKNPSEKIGDIQGISNIATDSAAKIYELWYQHSFIEGKLKILFGLHDYNSAFYSLDSAGLFTHPSFGIGPDTSQVGPSIFSTTSTALLVNFDDGTHYVVAAVYDGIPGDPNNPRGTHIRFDKGDGTFVGTEIGLKSENSYKIGFGLWQHTAKVASPLDGNPDNSNRGLYLIGEKTIGENTAAFLQFGRADDQSNQLEHYFGTGITVKNIFRTDDTFGVGIAHARNGSPFLDLNPILETAETTSEITYFSPLAKHINVQASIYYVKSPSMDKSIENALAVGARIYLEL